LPSHIVGIITLVALTLAIFARYGHRLAGAWRWIYVLGAVVALYLNVFVLIVQAFMKVPGLNALAPTRSEPPFLATQVVVLLISSCSALARRSGSATKANSRPCALFAVNSGGKPCS
jgi:hypothetical protein